MPTYTITVMGYSGDQLYLDVPGARVPLAGVQVYNQNNLMGSTDGSGQVRFEVSGTPACRYAFQFIKEFHLVARLYIYANNSLDQSYTLNMELLVSTLVHPPVGEPGSSPETFDSWRRGGFIYVSTVDWCTFTPAWSPGDPFISNPTHDDWVGHGFSNLDYRHFYEITHSGAGGGGGTPFTSGDYSAHGGIFRANEGESVTLDSLSFNYVGGGSPIFGPADYGLGGLTASRVASGTGTNVHRIVFLNRVHTSGCNVATCPLPTFPTAEPGAGPWCLQTKPGWYHVASTRERAIYYQRSSRVYGPPWHVQGAATAPATGTTDVRPRMVLEPRQRLTLAFERQTTGGQTVQRIHSDDDGRTWKDPVELFANATRPTVNIHPLTRRILYAAFRVDPVDEEVGTIVGRLQRPSQTVPGDEFTFQTRDEMTGNLVDLEVDADTFHFAPAPEGSERWLLVCVQGGNVKNYYSSDDGLTWRAVPEPTP